MKKMRTLRKIPSLKNHNPDSEMTGSGDRGKEVYSTRLQQEVALSKAEEFTIKMHAPRGGGRQEFGRRDVPAGAKNQLRISTRIPNEDRRA